MDAGCYLEEPPERYSLEAHLDKGGADSSQLTCLFSVHRDLVENTWNVTKKQQISLSRSFFSLSSRSESPRGPVSQHKHLQLVEKTQVERTELDSSIACVHWMEGGGERCESNH